MRTGIHLLFYLLKFKGLRQLVFLNCLIQNQDDIISEIPQQRLVFFVKHICDILNEVVLSRPLKTEFSKTLIAILPPIKEIYGSFWIAIVEFTQNTLSAAHTSSDDEIPSLHTSLRLLMTLHRLSTQESNDDLEYAWKESRNLIASRLLLLLSQLQCTSSPSSYSCAFTNVLSYSSTRRITSASKDTQ